MNNRAVVWIVGAVALFGATLFETAGPVLAQKNAEPSSDFFETVDVNVVNVEVYVTDKKGNPVPGLKKSDFEILEDGKLVEVSNFYAAYNGRPSVDGEVLVDAGEMELAAEEEAMAAIVPKDQRLNLVLFIDNNNLTPRSRNRVLEALRESIFFSLKPEDKVMLVSYDGGINIREPLANNPAEMAKALDELGKGSPRGVHAGLNRTNILRQLQQLDNEESYSLPNAVGARENVTGSLADSVLSEIRSYSQQQFVEIERTVAVLEGFVETLSGLSGRKAVVYVSDGLDLRPGEALLQAYERKLRELPFVESGFTNVASESREFDATVLFEELGRRANANRVTFHTILASGGQSLSLSPAERGAFFNDGADAATLGQVWDDGLQALETSNLRGSLQIMADATGGQATLSTHALGSALQRLKRDLDTYYSIGYVASHDDSDNHKIKVRVKNPALQVRHRESYRNLSPDEQMSARTRSALMFEVAENPLQVVVGIGEEEKDSKGRFLVPIMVKFPLANILLLPQEQFHEGRVSIYVGAQDSKGGTSPIQKLPAPIRIPNDQLLTALGQVAGFRVTLMMREGEHSVVVGVRDELANVESTAGIQHSPGGK